MTNENTRSLRAAMESLGSDFAEWIEDVENALDAHTDEINDLRRDVDRLMATPAETGSGATTFGGREVKSLEEFLEAKPYPSEEAAEAVSYQPGPTPTAEYALGARDTSELAKSIYREMHSGGCRMYSQGEACRCFLCQMDDYLSSVPQAPPAPDGDDWEDQGLREGDPLGKPSNFEKAPPAPGPVQTPETFVEAHGEWVLGESWEEHRERAAWLIRARDAQWRAAAPGATVDVDALAKELVAHRLHGDWDTAEDLEAFHRKVLRHALGDAKPAPTVDAAELAHAVWTVADNSKRGEEIECITRYLRRKFGGGGA